MRTAAEAKAWDDLAEAKGLRLAYEVAEIMQGERCLAPGQDRAPSTARDTFARLLSEGWPDGRARSQRRMAALCGVDSRTLGRWLRNSSAIPSSRGIAADSTPPDL